jgi:hypothetical protein
MPWIAYTATNRRLFELTLVLQEICGAFCLAVGFTGFETLIRTGSPVWICEAWPVIPNARSNCRAQMLGRCDYDDSDTASITSNTVSPTSGKQGQVFTFNLGWDLEVPAPASFAKLIFAC